MQKLIQRCLAGDGVAWGEIWQIYDHNTAQPVRKLLARAGFDATEADDVAVEIFVHLLEDDCTRLRSFQGTTKAEFNNWLAHLAVNFTRDWIEAARRAKGVEGNRIVGGIEPDQPGPIESVADRSGPTERQIEAALRDLNTVSGDDMHWLRVQAGLETEPAERTLKPASERTQRRRVHRLLEIVREFLGLRDRRK